MSVEDKNLPAVKRKRPNRFVRVIRSFFGCVVKNIEGSRYELVSVSCQCQIEKDLEPSTVPEKNGPVTPDPPVEDGESPATEEFGSSLKKLDTLITTLNNIHGVYKSKNSLQCYSEESDPWHLFTDEDSALSTEHEEDILKFNINFDQNTFIECQTRKGKRSLKIIHNSAPQNFSPLILHRCESEILLKRRSIESNNEKVSSEIFPVMSDHLQKSRHILNGKFGIPFCNFSAFKASLVDHMKNITNDFKTLTNILYHVECVANKSALSLPLSLGDFSWWLLGSGSNMKYSSEEDQVPEYKYLEAKIRATNFCRFYTLDRRIKEKKKTRNVHKKKWHSQ